MSYRTPPNRDAPVREVLDALEGASRILLTTHLNADGDGAGCQVALAAWLRSRGKEVWILNPTPFPSAFRFLLPEEDWLLRPSTERTDRIVDQAELGVVVDTGETPRLGRVKPFFDEVPQLVVVDHHPPGEKPVKGISFRDPSAAATGELIYDLVLASGDRLSPAMRDGLYVALLTDTGSFRFSNATPGAFRMAADLVEAGVRPEELHRKVYGSYPLRRLHLLREALRTLEVDEDGLVAWMTVPQDAYEALEVAPEDLDGFVDYPRSVEGVEVGILFRTLEDGSTKVSFRSTGDLDVNQVARRFGGGGHVKASGARVTAELEEVKGQVLEETLAVARRIRNQGGRDGVK